MSRALLIALVLAAVGGAYYLLTGGLEVTHPEAEQGAGQSPPVEAGATLGGPEASAPTVVQVPDFLQPTAPFAALMLTRRPTSWNVLMGNALRDTQGVAYAIWHVGDMGGPESIGGHMGEARDLPTLSSPPDRAWLDTHDIKVLIVDELDPHAVSDAFWAGVSDRVRRGVMGLLFHPGWPYGAGNEALQAHPALSHPVLRALLPVERAAELSGQPVPGVFTEGRVFRVTADGRRHAASRLVSDPDQSAQAWRSAGEGQHGLRTEFVYPVEKTREGAKVLTEVQGDGAEYWPALVATESSGRVLWMGNRDFGQEGYKHPRMQGLMATLVNHWVVWLAGQSG